MITAAELLAAAKKEVGVTEYPANSNTVKYNTWFYGRAVSGSDYPWCMAFIQWLFDHAGARLPYITAGCTSFMTYVRNNRPAQYITENFRAGDIALFDFDGKPEEAEHVGLITAVNKTTVETIEGNTSFSTWGSQDNGGAVAEKTREKSIIICAYRPDYDNSVITAGAAASIAQGAKIAQEAEFEVTLRELQKGCSGKDVEAMQYLLQANGYKLRTYGADGDFGAETDKALREYQQAKGLDPDGICGVKTWTKMLTGK